ncbi:hypothetical protein [Amycolatopsis anabasis]|uniref:hypothetical protein n=1 Tax=Amycolatopsis anabasis TaxID=1840409 RepID=UPI0015D41F98|nr:hypothetical protein [Amycolatopsis anabasis]
MKTACRRSSIALIVVLATSVLSAANAGGTPAPASDRVALRQLIVATEADDFGLSTWKTILDRVGTPYDVLVAKPDPLTADRLVKPDGTGRYSAILLTSNDQATAPAEQTLLYNSFYGPNGRWPYFDHNLGYAEMLDFESDVALDHVQSGSAYAHTVHQGNLRQYASGKSLTFDSRVAVTAGATTFTAVPRP